MAVSKAVYLIPLFLSTFCSACPSFEKTSFTPDDIVGPWYVLFTDKYPTIFRQDWECVRQYKTSSEKNIVSAEVYVLQRNQRWSNFTYKEEINQLDVNITYINILGQDKKYYLEHLDKFQSFIAYSCDEQSRTNIYALGRSYANMRDVRRQLTLDQKKYNFTLNDLKHASPDYCSLEFNLFY